jgi:hypothetical protein
VSSRPALELVNRHEPSSPRHIDSLEQRERAPVEGRAAEAERLRGLSARVREPLDSLRLAHNDRLRTGSLRGRRVTVRFLGPAPKSPACHVHAVHNFCALCTKGAYVCNLLLG